MVAKDILLDLIQIPSFSKEESRTADYIESFFQAKNIPTNRLENNIWAKNKFFDSALPTVLLNSHHDTVKPHADWSNDPFSTIQIDGKIIGLGANDAGGALSCLIQTFIELYEEKLPFNLLLLASAEEEISGKMGVELVLNNPDFPKITCGIVGEPTNGEMAIAEKGLLVIDATCKGKSGHAARSEGINAIEIALEDINELKKPLFPKISELLGPVKTTVTIIHAGEQHNVIPDKCVYTIDCRVNEEYRLEEVVSILKQHLKAELSPRSVRLQPSKLDFHHPLFLAGKSLGLTHYGSPTLSDQALMPFPTLKIGPGKSERSHTANEFILESELEKGILIYKELIRNLKF